MSDCLVLKNNRNPEYFESLKYALLTYDPFQVDYWCDDRTPNLGADGIGRFLAAYWARQTETFAESL
jgi:hypothetical protein